MSLQPYAFFDESGKWQDKNFICLCGYLSDEDHWNQFTAQWFKLCQDYELPFLHMTDYYIEAKKNGWSNEKMSKVQSEFANVIRNHILVGFAVGLDTTFYKSIPKEMQHRLDEPGVVCLYRLLRLIRNRLVADNYNGKISVTIDEEYGMVMNYYQRIDKLRKVNPDLGKYIGAVCFADDKFIVPLQAADMLANLTGRWFRDRMAGKASADEMPEPLKSLIVSPETGRGLDYEQEYWDKEALQENLPKLLGQ